MNATAEKIHLVITSQEQADQIRTRREAYKRECDRLFPGRNGFTPEMQAQLPEHPSNEETSALETWNFCRRKHDKHFVYVNEAKRTITTWTGQTLGKIVHMGHKARVGFGWSTYRQAIRVAGIDGRTYHGWYYVSSGDYARITACKAK